MATIHRSADVLWTPSPAHIASCALTRFARYLNVQHAAGIAAGDYHALHAWSVAHPALFWSSVAHFTHFLPTTTPLPPTAVIRRGRAAALPTLVNASWFPHIRLNFTHILLHRHAALHPHRPALIFRPEAAVDDLGYRRRLTFSHLQRRVHRLANALRAAGVRKGHAVAALLPNTPDAVVAMLATAALGAVWACCSPDFGVTAVAARLVDARPKVLFYAAAYRYKGRVFHVLDNVRRVAEALHSSLKMLVCVPDPCCADGASVLARQKLRVGQVAHVFLRDLERDAAPPSSFEYEMVTLDDPLVTMFSSGTTGKPKCIVQGCGILLNQLKEHVLHHDVSENCVMLFTTSTAWMLFNWLVAALGTGCTIVLFDGAALPPQDPYRLVRVADEEKVTHFGSGATFYEGLMNVHNADPYPGNGYAAQKDITPIPSLRMVLATGSPSTDVHFRFARSFFGAHVQYVSMSGGTEINGCFALGTPWKPVLSPQLQCAGLGMDVDVFDAAGQSVVGVCGELVCKTPCPCMPLYFAHDPEHHRYRDTYFSEYGGNVWSHGDFATKTNEGGFIIAGRSDATLNPGGVRIGTSDLYQVVESLDIVESALVTEQLQAGKSRIVMFVVLRHGICLDARLERQIRHMLRTSLSPRHVPHDILEVPEIPCTFSGKKCEVAVKRLLHGKDIGNSDALQNPHAIESIRAALELRALLPANANAIIDDAPREHRKPER